MKTDKNGCSTCKPGEENWERFYSRILGRWLIQYEYRTPAGTLFSCTCVDLKTAWARRDQWLKENPDTTTI